MKKVKESLAQVGNNPFVDWEIIFFVSIFLIVVCMGFGGYVFYRVNNGTFYSVEEKRTRGVTTLNREALSEIIDHFAQKEAVHSSLKQQRQMYVDPSL